MIELTPDWLRKVAFAIGKTEDETGELIRDWYARYVPLKQVETRLIELSKEKR